MQKKFNRLMPESEGPVICYEISQPISEEGYAANFLSPARAIIETYGEVRLLLYFTQYQGWATRAAEMDISAHSEFGRYVTKLALVNAPEKEIMARLLKKPMIAGELKFFSAADLQEALRWIKS